MKISLLILVVGLVCFTAGGELKARTRTFQPDLKTPVLRLKELLANAKGANIALIIKLVLNILTNCLPEIIGIISPPTLALTSDPKILEKIIPLTLVDDIKGYMSSAEFAEIHNHLWYNNLEWNDTIKLFYDAGWNESDPTDPTTIYQYFKQLYDIFECKLVLPTGPPATMRSQVQGVFTSKTGRSLKPLPSLEFLELFQEKPVCNTGEILQMIIDSKIVPVVELVLFVVQEVNTDASVHLLWATLTEPAKGTSFRETRSLPAFKKLVNHWDSQLKQNEIFQFVFDLLGGLTGIEFGGLNINVVANLISFIEFLVWGTPFPVPT